MNLVALGWLVAAYLVGSIPTALLVGKSRGIDLRTVGSGNLGATNVQRTLGWKAGLFVYVVDMLKGALPTALFPLLAGVAAGWPWGVAFGVATIAGHIKPIYLRGKGGGKGVATASGVFFALAPLASLVAMLAFIAVVWRTRYVSLGSLVGATLLPLVLLLQLRALTPIVVVSLIVSAFVFYTHRENIGRLRRGEERRISGKTA